MEDGGPAFPVPADRVFRGMSLRDHFAGLAMQGAVVNHVGANGFTFDGRAEWAYMQADAMIKARSL